LVKLTITADSLHAFARILSLILTSKMSTLREFIRSIFETHTFKVKDPITDAYNLALANAEYWTNLKLTLGNLFLNIAKALKEGDEKMLKTSIVKLFYYHI